MAAGLSGGGCRVHIENLSDHAGDLLGETQQLRIEAAEEVGRWQQRSDQASADLESARAGKGIWKRLFSVQTTEERSAFDRMEEAQHRISAADFRWRQLEPTLRQRHAGVAGEIALASGLSSLSDDWVLLRGYRNGRGETDAVLVGPLGVWAVEVKHHRARLTVDGERWSYEKLSRRGRVVDRRLAVDNSGRSWARQVNEVARDLAKSLARNEHRIPVRTAVILTNEGASIERCRDPEVDLVETDPLVLIAAMNERATPLSPEARRTIVELIRRDHR